MTEAIGHGSHLIDTGLYRPHHTACYLIEDQGELALIDTGTQYSLPAILNTIAELSATPQQVRYIIPTHVHLDHAGGTGQLMQQCPNATLLVHPRGQPHLIDPSKLQAGATAVYGEPVFQRNFGTLLPVPEQRTQGVGDLECFDLGGRRLQFLHTPGHANHHGCLFDQQSTYLFTGDTFGLAYRELARNGIPLLFATTTPVAFDPTAWMNSLDHMLALDPAACCVTHFGKIDAPRRYADQLRASLGAHEAIALEEEALEPEGREARLAQAIDRLLVSAGTAHSGLADHRVRELLAIDIDLNARGLAVWLARRAKRTD